MLIVPYVGSKRLPRLSAPLAAHTVGIIGQKYVGERPRNARNAFRALVGHGETLLAAPRMEDFAASTAPRKECKEQNQRNGSAHIDLTLGFTATE